MNLPAQHPLHDLRLPGPTLVLVDDSDSLALDALQVRLGLPPAQTDLTTLSPKIRAVVRSSACCPTAVRPSVRPPM